jgi:hypothetical protein
MNFIKKNILRIALLCMVASCKSEEEPSLKSLAGEWIYTFPDNEVSVTFKIAGTEFSSYYISSAVVKYGTLVQTSGGLADKNAPCNVNRKGDKLLQFSFQLLPSQGSGSYSILFSDPVTNSSFTELAITKATYTISNDGALFKGSEIVSPSPIKRK